MRYALLLIICTIFSFLVSAQNNVGIGISNPTEKLQIDSGAVKIGTEVWNSTKNYWLKFGDGDYTKIGENGDDTMNIYAKNIRLTATQAIYSGVTKVDIKGKLAVDDGTQTVGKILTCTATDGTASWQSAPNANTAFDAFASSDISLVGSGNIRLDLTTEAYDDGSNFGNGGNLSTFTAPSSGIYHFDVNLEFLLGSNASAYLIGVDLSTGFAAYYTAYNTISAGFSGRYTVNFGKDLKMTAGQTVTLYAYNGSGNNYTLIGARSHFSGHKVY